MPGLVVAVFDSEGPALAALWMLHAAGIPRRDIAVLSRPEPERHSVTSLARHLQTERLLGRDEGVWRAILWGVIIGSLVVEIPVLIWLFLWVDGETAASWGMGLSGLRLLLGSTVWKLGAFFGGFAGAALATDSGVDAESLRRYEAHLAQGELVLAARVALRRSANVRGIFIESGALEVRDISGSFVVAASHGTSRGR